ncbi:MAG TPA: carboxypeptidase-like regulatory domain-containing protein [Longimicrobium sp.]|jgi:hypothetical protein|uniref:carboxypeptidase-like regulatory domain-containing protein n=1 Tax=Longimicrobium sp. TaxID=2029185 RepID=UPI002ED9359B
MTTLRAALIALAALVLGVPLHAQSIRGRVVDAAGEGVPEASVVATGGGGRQQGVRTGADGAFVLALRGPGVYRLNVMRTGYAPATSGEITVSAAEAVEVAVRVAAQPLGLEAVTVTGRQGPRRIASLEPTGFYDREATGFGRFMRREEIERRRGARLAQLLDDVQGIRLYRDRRGTEYVTFTSQQSNGAIRRAQAGEADVCLPVMYLDGTMVSQGAANGPGGVSINDLVQTEAIEAIEAYGNASRIPPQYNGSNSACGVILIWTRSGN